MDIASLQQYMVPVIVGICLCVGYVIKQSLDFIPNKYIPLIVLVLGSILNIIMNKEFSVTILFAGMISGLGSTGFYELFKNLIEKK